MWLRELLVAGKFNLMFGLLFGIGFHLQLGRLEAARPGGGATLVYARRLAVLLAIGLVHAALLWSGDVLVVYAVLGFGLLAIRRWPDRAVIALIFLCLVFPAAADALRPVLLSFSTETVAAFEYEDFEVSNAAAFGHGSFLDAMRETARVFAWGYTSPLGQFSYAAFYVQMATGILLGFLVGRRAGSSACRPCASRSAGRSLPPSARHCLPARCPWPSPLSAPSPTAPASSSPWRAPSAGPR